MFFVVVAVVLPSSLAPARVVYVEPRRHEICFNDKRSLGYGHVPVSITVHRSQMHHIFGRYSCHFIKPYSCMTALSLPKSRGNKILPRESNIQSLMLAASPQQAPAPGLENRDMKQTVQMRVKDQKGLPRRRDHSHDSCSPVSNMAHCMPRDPTQCHACPPCLTRSIVQLGRSFSSIRSSFAHRLPIG
jgi:hypothetical protein